MTVGLNHHCDTIDLLRAETKERPLARTKELRYMRSKRRGDPVDSFEQMSGR